ncbi:MAG: DGQHR domain-containing protein [Oscillatoriales cyanobacterium]|uniref:DNA sulfur modification protein DndB n=1 Tax=Microcoleus anatoxicus PTRS2 TaxID=2705321 RepID=A0ABU8YWE2_9CYAN|nr:MAG: DGQHR domain-containing protein [Oscillatoriales cyanobacterium]TAF70823.1 MAG: DGQHR domain-containing protein [Oscillatoriales cyanobacterium]
MALVIPCIKGRIGDTEYYQATMLASDLVHRVRPAKELDEWATMTVEDRLQREPDYKRVESEIAPYIAQTKDRFFGSMIVLVYKGKIDFENINSLNSKLPNAYKTVVENMGVLTINGGSLIMLDGQHRLLALEKVIKAQVNGSCREQVPNDEICVIFINHESNEKTRRIFNKVNRYAKPTSKGDNIITSEDDGYAIIARRLLSVGAPLGVRDKASKDSIDVIVEWKQNTLPAKSTKLTTISGVYETVKLILNSRDVQFDIKTRPSEEELDSAYELAEQFWNTVLEGSQPYREALADNSQIPEMRQEDQPYSLLFRPTAQIALFRGLTLATTSDRLSLTEAVHRANKIDWRMTSPIWTNVLVRPGGALDKQKEANRLASKLIAYLIAADKMTEEEVGDIWRSYNLARGYDVHNSELGTESEALPKSVTEIIYQTEKLAA